MLGAMRPIVDLPFNTIIVRVVEDHTVLYTAGGVVAGAIVGLLGSWFQQRSKIDADKKQLEKRLVAEETRHEREALRDVLDEAMEAARVGYNVALEAIRSEAFGQRYSLGMAGLAGSKLVIRLGRNHPVEVQYRGLRDALEATNKLIAKPLEGESPATRRPACSLALRDVLRGLQDFADTAADLVGSPLAKVP
jgi:hypothetical protein